MLHPPRTASSFLTSIVGADELDRALIASNVVPHRGEVVVDDVGLIQDTCKCIGKIGRVLSENACVGDAKTRRKEEENEGLFVH